MNSKKQKELAKKQASSRPVQEANAKTNGVDAQVASVRQNTIDLGGENQMSADLPLSSGGRPSIANAATPRAYVDNTASSTLSDAKQFTNDRLNNYYTDNQVNNLLDNYYTIGQTNTAISNAIPNSTGNTTNFNSASDHRHSISSTTFIQLSQSERLRMLDDYAELLELHEKGILSRREKIQARNTLNLLSLLLNYKELNAFERERRFRDPEWAEWTAMYKRVYGVDEFAEVAIGEFIAHDGVHMHPHRGIASSSGTSLTKNE